MASNPTALIDEGAAQAAVALARLVSGGSTMPPTRCADDAAGACEGGVAIDVSLSGEVLGTLWFTWTAGAALRCARGLTGRATAGALTQADADVLCEVANIGASAFANAVADARGGVCLPSVPRWHHPVTMPRPSGRTYALRLPLRDGPSEAWLTFVGV